MCTCIDKSWTICSCQPNHRFSDIPSRLVHSTVETIMGMLRAEQSRAELLRMLCYMRLYTHGQIQPHICQCWVVGLRTRNVLERVGWRQCNTHVYRRVISCVRSDYFGRHFGCAYNHVAVCNMSVSVDIGARTYFVSHLLASEASLTRATSRSTSAGVTRCCRKLMLRNCA
jgi:hypothetical protein